MMPRHYCPSSNLAASFHRRIFPSSSSSGSSCTFQQQQPSSQALRCLSLLVCSNHQTNNSSNLRNNDNNDKHGRTIRSSFQYRFFGSNQEEEEEAPFDRHSKWKQKTRAAESSRQYYNNYIQNHQNQNQHYNNPDLPKKPPLPYDYFHKEVANRLVERLQDINLRELDNANSNSNANGSGEGREGFPLALEIGAGAGFVHEAIVSCVMEDELDLLDDSISGEEYHVTGIGGIRKLVQMDSCSAMLHRDDVFHNGDGNSTSGSNSNGGGSSTKVVCETYKLVAEEEHALPFPDGTFDLVISSMAFHWINDLPKMLSEIKRVLKPNGCLLFSLPGGNTLPELRSSLVLAELERTGGVSTHVGPYMDISNVGSLLTGTGFTLPTIDVDEIHIGYPNMMVLMEHLGRMGEGNVSVNRKERVGLGTFLGAACLYRELYPSTEEEEDGEGEGGIVASAQVIYGIAWKEHESQQKPDERGSASRKMTDIAVTKTTSSGE